MCICVLLQIFALFSSQEFWQSWMRITLIIKKPSKENLLGLPQTWTALIRTQSSLVGCQDQGLWGKMFSCFHPPLLRLLSVEEKTSKNSAISTEISENQWRLKSCLWPCIPRNYLSFAFKLIQCFLLIGLTMQFRPETSFWFSPLWVISTTAAAYFLCQTAASILLCCLERCSFDAYLCEPCVFQMGKTAVWDKSSTSERSVVNQFWNLEERRNSCEQINKIYILLAYL